jgi:hypothetical protein
MFCKWCEVRRSVMEGGIGPREAKFRPKESRGECTRGTVGGVMVSAWNSYGREVAVRLDSLP